MERPMLTGNINEAELEKIIFEGIILRQVML